MKFFLIARFLSSRNNSVFPFFSFLLRKKELEILIFLKFFDINFFFSQKKKRKRKQSNITKNIGNIFRLNWICWSLWKVRNSNRANEKLFSFDLIEQKFPLLRKDKINGRKLTKDSYKNNFFFLIIVRLNFPKFR